MTKAAQRLQSRVFNRSNGMGIPGYAAAVVAGALLGGVALALLNRKTIQELREKLDQRPGSSSDDIY
jgi:hypothetical protein